MRTTLSIDDELLATAQEMTGVKEKSTLVRMGLEYLVQREAAKRLALLGGSAPDLVLPPRRRWE
jgi:Arc/MetJ family transcription regulator